MLPPELEREIEAAGLVRNLQERVRRLETLEHLGGGDFVLIEHQTGTTFDFTDIPTLFTHLFMIHSVAAITPPVGDSIGLTFNGDTGANYNWIRRLWTGSAESTFVASGAGLEHANIGLEGTASPRFSSGYVLIADYLSTAKLTTYEASGFVMDGSNFRLYKLGGIWSNTDALNQITPIVTYIAGSIFSLYGIR